MNVFIPSSSTISDGVQITVQCGRLSFTQREDWRILGHHNRTTDTWKRQKLLKWAETHALEESLKDLRFIHVQAVMRRQSFISMFLCVSRSALSVLWSAVQRGETEIIKERFVGGASDSQSLPVSYSGKHANSLNMVATGLTKPKCNRE